MYPIHYALVFGVVLATASTPQLATDPGKHGPPIELVHVYNDQFPTGM